MPSAKTIGIEPNPTRQQGSRQPQGLLASLRQLPLMIPLLVLILLGLIVTAVLFFRYPSKGGDGVTVSRIRTERLNTQSFDLQEALAEQYYPFTDESVIRVSDHYVTYYDYSGNTLLSFSIETAHPEVIVHEGRALVYDRNGTQYYQFNKEGMYLLGETPHPIRHATLSDRGDFALMLQDPQSRGILRVMDADGTHRMDWSFYDLKDSGYIIAMDYSAKGDAIDVSLLNTDGLTPTTIAMRIGLESMKAEWTHKLEGVGSLPLMGQDQEGTRYLSDGQKVYQMSEKGVMLWMELQDNQTWSSDRNGMWAYDEGTGVFLFQPWTAAGTPALAESQRVFDRKQRISSWIARDMQLYLSYEDGTMERIHMKQPDQVETLSATGEGMIRGSIFPNGKVCWITPSNVTLYDGSLTR